MLKNTEAFICILLFSHQFSDRSYSSYMLKNAEAIIYFI